MKLYRATFKLETKAKPFVTDFFATSESAAREMAEAWSLQCPFSAVLVSLKIARKRRSN